MKAIGRLLRREPMLTASLAAAVAALVIQPPSRSLLAGIDWHTLATLAMMLTVLEGFKSENIFRPLVRLSGRITSQVGLTFFLVFAVFFSSMFVTNDVSLIIFVPLTILLFRAGDKERYILPVLAMENIAAVRGSMLTPFGSPQNLFLFGRSGISVGRFLLMMLPLWLLSGALLCGFILLLYRRDLRQRIRLSGAALTADWRPEGRPRRLLYLGLFLLVVWEIVSRTPYWPAVLVIVLAAVLIGDRRILRRTDYVLLLTFFCFFVFSSSITANPTISGLLNRVVAGHEYLCGILVSQVISNVPAAIVLYPFSESLPALLYGVDTAGLCTLIGSLASVINYRLYVREYPDGGGRFIRVFTAVSLAFFALVVLPGYFLSR